MLHVLVKNVALPHFSCTFYLQLRVMAEKAQEPVSFCVDSMEVGLSAGGSPKKCKVENLNVEVQRLSQLPRRSPVNLEFNNLSYTVPDGPWWWRRGTAS